MKRLIPLIALFLLLSTAICAEEAWEEFHILPGESVWASSVLEENLRSGPVRYPPQKIFDGDPATAWVEGVAGLGVGEHVSFILDRPVESVALINGFARSERLYRLNGRPRELECVLQIGFTAPGLISETDARLFFVTPLGDVQRLYVSDTARPQTFFLDLSPEEQIRLQERAFDAFCRDYPFFADEISADLDFGPYQKLSTTDRAELRSLALVAYAHTFMRLTITEVFPGARYEDTAISEVEIGFK